MKRKFFTLLTIGITCGALYAAFRNTDIAQILDHMRRGEYLYAVPALVGLILYAYLRALRWGYFFDVRLRPGLLFSTTMIGLMANNIFPARAGEFLKAYLLGRHARISKSRCLATVLLERVWDGLTLLLFIGALTVGFFLNAFADGGDTLHTPLIRFAVFISAGVYIVVLVLALAWKSYHVAATSFLTRVLAKASPRIADYAASRLASFSSGFSIFHDPKKIVIVSLYSIAIWLSAVVTLFLMLKVFSFELPATASFILVILIGLFVMIPSVGSLGTMQLAFVLGLALYGVDKNRALSFSIVYQFFDTVPVIVFGLIYFFKDGLSFREVASITEEKI